jgi:hypothetical protein
MFRHIINYSLCTLYDVCEIYVVWTHFVDRSEIPFFFERPFFPETCTLKGKLAMIVCSFVKLKQLIFIVFAFKNV